MRRGKGLNENLAREILELHTLGVRTGYTQTDVTNFAKVITGWTIVPPRLDPGRGGEFMFNARMHEPGAQTVIGRTYADDGFAQGAHVLRTSRTIRRPPSISRPSSPAILSPTSRRRRWSTNCRKRFRDTGGDLREVTQDAGDRAGDPGPRRAAS